MIVSLFFNLSFTSTRCWKFSCNFPQPIGDICWVFFSARQWNDIWKPHFLSALMLPCECIDRTKFLFKQFRSFRILSPEVCYTHVETERKKELAAKKCADSRKKIVQSLFAVKMRIDVCFLFVSRCRFDARTRGKTHNCHFCPKSRQCYFLSLPMHTANWAADIYMLQDHFKIVIWSTTIYGLLFAILCKSYHFIWWNGFTKRQPKIISHLKSVVLECFFLSRVIVLIEQKQEIDAKKMKRFVMLILNKILSTNEYRERMKWYRE